MARHTRAHLGDFATSGLARSARGTGSDRARHAGDRAVGGDLAFELPWGRRGPLDLRDGAGDRPSAGHEGRTSTGVSRAALGHDLVVERRAFPALGGDCELFGLDAGPDALAQGEAWVRRLHDRLTRFEPTSELSRFNASAGRWVDISPELAQLLRESLRAFEVSDGLVHVGVLPALLAAGYTRDFALGPTARTAPPSIAPLPHMLEVRAAAARLSRGAAIDLGGIAKGWMADRLAERLGENTLVNLCGDLFARGGGETGEGWPVGFGDRTLLLKDMGAATSGTTKRSWDGGHHLIDPRTGLPARSDLTEVSVLAWTAADAEIYAKVALLLGSRDAPRYLEGRSQGWSFS